MVNWSYNTVVDTISVGYQTMKGLVLILIDTLVAGINPSTGRTSLGACKMEAPFGASPSEFTKVNEPFDTRPTAPHL